MARVEISQSLDLSDTANAAEWIDVAALGAERAQLQVLVEKGSVAGGIVLQVSISGGDPATIDTTLAASTGASAGQVIQWIDVQYLGMIRAACNSASAGTVARLVWSFRKSGPWIDEDGPAADAAAAAAYLAAGGGGGGREGIKASK